MKKLLSILAIASTSALVHAQGFIELSTSNGGIVTNTSSFYSQGAGTTGKTPTTANGFFYALLFDTSNPGATAPTNSAWTVATQQGGASLALVNNNGPTGAGGITGVNGTSGVATSLGVGQAYVQLVGWSASLGGANSLSTILAEYASDNWSASGYFGFTGVGSITTTSSSAGQPQFFGTAGNDPFSVGALQLYSVVPIPEPASMALIGLGGASLLLFRRKK